MAYHFFELGVFCVLAVLLSVLLSGLSLSLSLSAAIIIIFFFISKRFKFHFSCLKNPHARLHLHAAHSLLKQVVGVPVEAEVEFVRPQRRAKHLWIQRRPHGTTATPRPVVTVGLLL